MSLEFPHFFRAQPRLTQLPPAVFECGTGYKGVNDTVSDILENLLNFCR